LLLPDAFTRQNDQMDTLDALDARLLLALDESPNATILALSRTLGVARNTVHARLARLDRQRALREPSRRVDPAALGYSLVAFVSIALSQQAVHLAEAGLKKLPEVVEIHSTTGDSDLLVKVVARSTEELHRVTVAILAIEGVVRTSTAISLVELMPLRLSALLEATAGAGLQEATAAAGLQDATAGAGPVNQNPGSPTNV
jgi:DNA-binding Lrp family transcriptional regulator